MAASNNKVRHVRACSRARHKVRKGRPSEEPGLPSHPLLPPLGTEKTVEGGAAGREEAGADRVDFCCSRIRGLVTVGRGSEVRAGVGVRVEGGQLDGAGEGVGDELGGERVECGREGERVGGWVGWLGVVEVVVGETEQIEKAEVELGIGVAEAGCARAGRSTVAPPWTLRALWTPL